MAPTSKNSGSKRKSSPRKQYHPENLERAFEEARKTGIMRRTAQMFHVPFSTVQRYIGTPSKGQKPDPGTVLTAEEEARIKTWVLYMSRAGFPLSRIYSELIQKAETGSVFSWRKKRITKLSKAVAVVTEQQIRHWFLEVEETLREDGIELSIFDEPERINNFDESGFKLVPQDFNAICGPNVENSYFVHNNSSKNNYTVLFGRNVVGTLTPPMILYPGKRVTRETVENTPNGWSVGVSDEGWQTSKTFYEYMTNDFYNWLLHNHIKFPVVVFVDGHKSHISIELTEFCTTHEIMSIALYPNSTRILQPLDRQFFGPFKQIWNKVLGQHLLGRSDAKVTKVNFCSLLKTSLENISNSKECLKKAFKICGLSPWDVNEVDFSRLAANANRNLTENTESDAQQEAENSSDSVEPEDDQDEFMNSARIN